MYRLQLRTHHFAKYAHRTASKPTADHILEVQEVAHVLQTRKSAPSDPTLAEVKSLLNGPLNITACSRESNHHKGCSMQRALQEGCSGSREQYRQDAVSRDRARLLADAASNPGAKKVFIQAGDAAQARRTAFRRQVEAAGGMLTASCESTIE
jgi:hypothetical protein